MCRAMCSIEFVKDSGGHLQPVRPSLGGGRPSLGDKHAPRGGSFFRRLGFGSG